MNRILWLPGMVTIGFGICLSNTRAVLEALFNVKSGFVRTPKSGESVQKLYQTKRDWVPIAELCAAFYCIITVIASVSQGVYGGFVFFFFYGVGFFVTGMNSLSEQKVRT